MTPTRLPMNISRLSVLLNACGIDLDENLVCCPDLFDPSEGAPDQNENLLKNFPELVEQLENYVEGVLYLRFDDAMLLGKVYNMDIVRALSPSAIKKAAHLARYEPALLAFRVTLPSRSLPEIKEEQFDLLTEISGHRFSIGERSAVVLYHKWLKNDFLRYGHTFSIMSAAGKHCPFKDQGIAFLLKNKIIAVEDGTDVYLTEVLKMEDNIRIACDTLQERSEEENRKIPLRDHDKDPYDKVKSLVVLDEEQAAGLEVVNSNPISILSGKAGTGKDRY